MTLFVGLTALAVVLQAVILVSIYILTRRVAVEVESTLGQVREMTPTLKAVTENLKTVSVDIVGIGSAAREQVHRVENMIGDTNQTLQDQLEKVDRMSRNISDRVNETVDLVQDSIVRPVREVGALAHGISTGLEMLLRRKDRPTVDQVRQDEELFI